MDVIFLAFANNSKAPLDTLTREDKEVYNLLSPRALKQQFLIHRDSFATKETLVHNLEQYKNHIRLFLYSGHAEQHALLTDDGEAHARGISELLSQCPKLQLVFLNGCSTKGQVEALLEKGVPAVIATSAPVNDEKATHFSIRFFQALVNQSTIREAFDSAKGAILTDHPDMDIQMQSGTINLASLGEKEGTWGLYAKEEEPQKWALPMNTGFSIPDNYTENERLLDALVNALSAYKEKARDILEDEAEGSPVSLGPKLDLIISSLPEVLSDQLKKLLIPSTGNLSDGAFFDKVGTSRLQQLVISYQSLMQLLTFTMLAQVWDELSNNEGSFSVPPETLEMIRAFLKLKPGERETYDLTKLIGELRGALDANDKPYFINELKDFAKKLNESEKHQDALQFLEHLKSKAFSKQLTEEEAKQLCVIAEEKLATILREIGFLSNYTLASVKTIDVLKYRHYVNPKYRHNIVKLIQFGASPPLQESEKLKKALDSNSVLLYKETSEGREYLNLSPFVIDNNSFNPAAKDAQLFFFYSCNPESEVFEFVHAYKPLDPLLAINEQKYFPLIRPQFEAFSQSFFKQALNAI